MSHLHSVEQASAMVPAYHPLEHRHPDAGNPSSGGFDLDELRFRRLQTPAQIASVMHLRREIRLPEATLTDAGFAAREKKETRSGLLVLSSSRAA